MHWGGGDEASWSRGVFGGVPWLPLLVLSAMKQLLGFGAFSAQIMTV